MTPLIIFGVGAIAFAIGAYITNEKYELPIAVPLCTAFVLLQVGIHFAAVLKATHMNLLLSSIACFILAVGFGGLIKLTIWVMFGNNDPFTK